MAKMNRLLREFLAECLGTMILVAMGCGGIAANILSKTAPDIFSIGFSFGIGLLIGISIAGPVSGAHLNPAVTVALATLNKFPWKKVGAYVSGQYLGGFLGAALVYLVYYQGISQYEANFISSLSQTNATLDKVSLTGGIFATYPPSFLGVGEAITDQVISCALLMIAVLAITDEKGINTPKHLQPIALSFVIVALILAYGYNCGAALNPARDLAPRIFTAIVGYGLDVFKPLNFHYWWTAGLVAPHLGCIIGGWCYSLTVGMHNNDDSSSDSVSTLVAMPIIKNDIMIERARQVIDEGIKGTKNKENGRF